MPLRFCMVTTFYPPYHFGGDAVFVHALSHALAEQGHEVHVVHCEDAYRLRGRETKPVESSNDDARQPIVHRLRSRFGSLSPLITQQTGMPGLKRAELEKILSQSFDVIHFHNVSLVGGPGVLEMGNAPVKLYTTHEHWLVCPMHVLWKNKTHSCDGPECFKCCLISGTPPQLWRYSGLLQRSLEHVDALLTPSEYTAKIHREAFPQSRVEVLPLFALKEHFDGPANTVAPARASFVFAGRLTASKGIVELVECFRKMPEYELKVAGDGELLKAISNRIAGCPNIHLLGRVPRERMRELYSQATALIVPSIGPESFGLVSVEAMACGTPVIVRQAGGSAEVVHRTGGGIVYQTEPQLESAIRKLANDPVLRQSMANQAREGVEQHFTTETHLKQYFRIIEEVRQRRSRVTQGANA